MSVLNVRGDRNGYYSGYTRKTDKAQEIFDVEVTEKTENNNSNGTDIPDAFKGMSLMDLLTSSDLKKNQIPVINQIISSKNPEDGEIYRTYFMDDQIFCNNADGKKAWGISINDAEQKTKMADFLQKYTSYEAAGRLYPGIDMEMITLESFWREFLNKP